MAIETRDLLKTFFQTGDIPTEVQFGDVIDSYIHQTDDNVTIYLEAGTTDKRFGIGSKTPVAPLGIKATGTHQALAGFNKADHEDAAWLFTLNPTGASGLGFNIDEQTVTGAVSRLFIHENDGYVGIGTVTPNQKLNIHHSSVNSVTGIKLLNTASLANNGFGIGHEQNSIPELNGAFSIYENNFSQDTKRLSIAKGGNVGINELFPDTKLHISRDLALPQTDLALIPGTGIVTIGPITQNIVADYRGIQARTGAFVGTVVDLTASELNLQRMGGDILIHGNDTSPLTTKGIITNAGNFGLGTITPAERIEIAGAIKIGTTVNTNDGTIRYTGSDFEGRKAGAWVSLTSGGGAATPSLWAQGTGNTISYAPGAASRVAIGTTTPTASLDIENSETVTAGSKGAIITNTATSTGTLASDTRVALELITDGTWAGHDQKKNVGLYISKVSGQALPSNNIAAVMNGNVMIGQLGGGTYLGAGADKVLSIQNGTAPGTVEVAVQIYAQNFVSGGVSASTLHVMRSNGDVVKLYKEAPLTASIEYTGSGAGDDAAIINLRTRLNELEARLQNIGFL
jgi:hypothetical protein